MWASIERSPVWVITGCSTGRRQWEATTVGEDLPGT